MASRRNKSVLTLSIVWMIAAVSSAQGPASPAAAGTKTVALSQGSCAAVATGDVVTFTWNPAFSPALTAGLHDMVLAFARADSTSGKNGIPHGGFILEAQTGKRRPAVVSTPIAALQNGFFLITFRANLEAVQPGQYTLVDATATPETGTAASGEPPVMTNSPKNSYFCLEVTSSPTGKR